MTKILFERGSNDYIFKKEKKLLYKNKMFLLMFWKLIFLLPKIYGMTKEIVPEQPPIGPEPLTKEGGHL